MLDTIARDPVDPGRARTLLQEMVRGAIAQMMSDLEAPPPTDHEEDRLAAICAELAAIKSALKPRDWSAAEAVAGTLGLDNTALGDPGLARQVLATRKRRSISRPRSRRPSTIPCNSDEISLWITPSNRPARACDHR
ncbi:hypothetical protein N0B44_11660 [Roseibacterium beibuensis]|uniref:Uncharacterized protein n=1 Tax=[Roseibacterium] beibuensis TaxID=1193142 RepID=A0ABP9LF23_9RHOB|nr:hypothetical protein [Roseibacterium beibuensis]MCS6623572.1 hypothetical protein [Roseibacterium beibuensis]